MNWAATFARFGPGIEKTTLIAGRSPVAAVLCVGLVISIMTSSAQLLGLFRVGNWPHFVVIVMATLALFELARALATRAAPLPVVPFLVGTLLLGVGVRIAYVSLVQPEWYTDFLRYWVYGLKLAESDTPEVLNVYAQRAYFLTRPLIEIFGDDRRIIPAANIALLTAIQMLGYDVLRRVRSHQAAQAFSLLWLVSPEPLMTSAVPNHDLAGLFLLSIALWLWLVGRERSAMGRPRQAFALWVLLGIVLSLLESVRGLGTLTLLVLGLLTGAVAVICYSRHLSLQTCRPMILALLVTAASFVAFNVMLKASGATMPLEARQANMLRYTTPHSTSLSDGTYNFMFGFAAAFTNEIRDLDEFSSFRKSLVISDFIQDPLDRIGSSAARMERQYSLASQRDFYLRGVDGKVHQWISVFTNAFVILFSALLLISIYLLMKYRLAALSVDHYLLLLVACSSIALLAIGENQPRYMSLIWLAGAVVIASQLSLGAQGSTPSQNPAVAFVASASFLLVLALIAWLFFSTLFKYADGRVLDDWTFLSDSGDARKTHVLLSELQDRTTEVIVGRRGKTIPTDFGKLSLKLMLTETPSSSHLALAEQKVCGVRDNSALDFYYDFPAKHLAGRDAYELQVLLNGESVWSAMLPNAGHPVRVRLPLKIQDDRCVRIAFQVVAHTRSHLVSWQNASIVEIFFSRIVRGR